MKILKSEGEEIKEQEMMDILTQLTGKSREEDALKLDIDAKYFAEEILGFEEIDDNEEEAEFVDNNY